MSKKAIKSAIVSTGKYKWVKVHSIKKEQSFYQKDIGFATLWIEVEVKLKPKNK